MLKLTPTQLDFGALFDALSQGVAFVQHDGLIAYLNPKAEELLHAVATFRPGALLHQQVCKLYKKDGAELKPTSFAALAALAPEAVVQNATIQVRPPTGATIWLCITADAVRGRAPGVLFTFTRYQPAQTNAELHLGGNTYKALFSACALPVFLTDGTGTCLDVSKGTETLFGYTEPELLQLGPAGVLVPGIVLQELLAERDATGAATATVQGVKKNGDSFPVLLYTTRFETAPGTTLVSYIMMDVSETQAVKKAAQHTAFNLDLILRNTDEAFLITDTQLQVVTFNQAYRRLVHLFHNKSVQAGGNILHFLSEKWKGTVQHLLQEALRGNIMHYERSHVVDKNETKVFTIIVRPLFDAGAIIGTFTQIKDVTAQAAMERNLRRSNERFELAAKASYDLICEINLSKGLIYFNDAMETVFLHPQPSPLPIKEFRRLLADPVNNDIRRAFKIDFLQSSAQRAELPVLQVRRGDGSLAYIEGSCVKANDEAGRPVRIIMVIRDISERYAFEKKLRYSNERFSMVGKATNDIVYENNPQDNRIYFNEALFDTLGYAPHEFTNLQTAYKTLVHPDDLAAMQAQVQAHYNSTATVCEVPDFRMVHKNGSIVIVELKFAMRRNSSGQPVKTYGSIKNITERYRMLEELRKSNERFELAAKASYDIIWDVDVPQQTIYFSKGIEANLGIAGPMRISTTDLFKNMLHPDDAPRLFRAFDAYVESLRPNGELPQHRMRRADGTYAWMKAKMYSVMDANRVITRVIGVTTDITAQIEAEQRLKRLNENLEQQALELKRSNAELERFAYVASHDLQEPLRMVSSFLSLLKKRFNHQLDDSGRQYIHFAVDGAERMKQLILDLLQYSRIGATGAVKAHVNTNQLVQALLQEFVFAIEEKKAQLEVAPLPDVVANRSQLIQVFQNLISNALKYAQGQPHVCVGGGETPTHWTFYVSDNGIGIDPKYFEKIFIIFQQLHTKSMYSGTGIGLAITKKIIEQHGGKIWVQSEPGRGSSFHFSIRKD